MGKSNKIVALVGVAWLIIATICIVIVGYMEKWDVKAWLTSQSAIWIYLFVSLYLLFLVVWIILEKWRKL